MGFVGQILIKLETSSFEVFFCCLFDVAYANILVATQWPLKRAPISQVCVHPGLCGMEVWTLIGTICAMYTENFLSIVFAVIWKHITK